MIIRTRYRDVPFEGAIKCETEPADDAREQWDAVRGKPLLLLTPACTNNDHGTSCHGPFYERVDGRHCVCPHTAEIGD